MDKRLARHDAIGGEGEAGVLIGRQADRAPLPLLRTVDALGVLTGAQIFSLQKEEFRAVSPEEGARVYSQVTVQRALLEVSRAARPPVLDRTGTGEGARGSAAGVLTPTPPSRTKRTCQSWRP